MLKERPESIIRNTSANLQQDFNRLSKSQTNVTNTTVSNIEPVLILMETATSCNSHEKLPDLSQTEKHVINSTSSFINSTDVDTNSKDMKALLETTKRFDSHNFTNYTSRENIATFSPMTLLPSSETSSDIENQSNEKDGNVITSNDKEDSKMQSIDDGEKPNAFAHTKIENEPTQFPTTYEQKTLYDPSIGQISRDKKENGDNILDGNLLRETNSGISTKSRSTRKRVRNFTFQHASEQINASEEVSTTQMTKDEYFKKHPSTIQSKFVDLMTTSEISSEHNSTNFPIEVSINTSTTFSSSVVLQSISKKDKHTMSTIIPEVMTKQASSVMVSSNSIDKSSSLSNLMSSLRSIDPKENLRSSIEISTNIVKGKSNTEHIIEVDDSSTIQPGTEIPENTLEKPFIPHEYKIDSKEQGTCSIE